MLPESGESRRDCWTVAHSGPSLRTLAAGFDNGDIKVIKWNKKIEVNLKGTVPKWSLYIYIYIYIYILYLYICRYILSNENPVGFKGTVSWLYIWSKLCNFQHKYAGFRLEKHILEKLKKHKVANVVLLPAWICKFSILTFFLWISFVLLHAPCWLDGGGGSSKQLFRLNCLFF